MMKCVGVINVTGGWDWSTSPHNCLLEMLSVLLMAEVRNVQIARPTLSSSEGDD